MNLSVKTTVKEGLCSHPLGKSLTEPIIGQQHGSGAIFLDFYLPGSRFRFRFRFFASSQQGGSLFSSSNNTTCYHIAPSSTMPVAAPTSRLKYLDAASHLLVRSSPSTSAHLGAARRELVEDIAGGAPLQTSSDSCTACGNILIPGLSCNYVKVPQPKRTRKDRLQKKHDGLKVIKLLCSRCNTATVLESPKRDRAIKTKDSRVGGRFSIMAGADATTEPPRASGSQSNEAPTASSRKRARSKKSSLQSIVTDKKTANSIPSNGFGLDLMDLMKT